MIQINYTSVFFEKASGFLILFVDYFKRPNDEFELNISSPLGQTTKRILNQIIESSNVHGDDLFREVSGICEHLNWEIKDLFPTFDNWLHKSNYQPGSGQKVFSKKTVLPFLR